MFGTGQIEFLAGVPRYVLFSLAVSLLLLAVFLIFYFTRMSAPAPLRQPPGSRVALAIGEHFAPSDRFTGFIDEKSGASVVVLELPAAAYEQLKRIGNMADAFEAQGLLQVERVKLPSREGEYICLRGHQKTALVDYAKYVLIFPAKGMTVMLTVNVPEAALTSGAVTGTEIERIFRSATVMADAMEAPALFRLDYLGSFEEDLSLLGTTKGYRLNGRGTGAQDGDDAKLRPLFLVAPSLNQAPIPNLTLFGERAFQTIEQVQEKRIEQQRDVEVAGMKGVEVIGNGIDAKSGEPAIVYQLVLEARHGGYFRLVGLAPAVERDKYLPEFSKIARSFQPLQ